jgi:molecular chaperone DnaJ
METRTLYVVLGVSPSEPTSAIRHAFRELAHRYHPDRAGSQALPFFHDIVDAYRVLSDPHSRASYDQGLRDAGELPLRPPLTPAFHPEPESLAPTRLSLFHDFEVGLPSMEEVFRRFARSFSEPDYPKSQRLDALNLEILLPADEAARGGVLELAVPVFYPCRACHGSGQSGLFPCAECRGQGMIDQEEPVRVAIPPRLRDGTLLQIPLRGLGINGMFLQLHLRVAGTA